MKILHISESFEGGVASAVNNYVNLTSEHEHFLLCSKRSGRLDCEILSQFSTVYNLTNSLFPAIKTVRHVVDKVKPDVIHCHSSFGGGYGRLAYFGRRRPALMVYSPHCYAFERRDVSWFGRVGFYIMEWVLSRKTDVVVACSLRETKLAQKLRKKTRKFFVPNLPSVKNNTSLPFGKRENLVVMVGRLTSQKDPGWFAEVASKVSGADFVWVGDGESRYRNMLEEANVEVTGWVEPKKLAKILEGAKVYFHTARWEGFPITILDANNCGVAIAARGASYLDGVRGEKTESIEEAIKKIKKLIENNAVWQKNRAAWEEALVNNNSLFAAKQLGAAYETKTKRLKEDLSG